MSASTLITKIKLENSLPDITENTNVEPNNLLPEKSRHLYEKCYEEFVKWQKANNLPKMSVSENVVLLYFEEHSQKHKPSTLWSRYSMLRSVIIIKYKVDLSTYSKLIAFLKRKSEGFEGKKSKTFTPNEIKRFLDEAPFKYLMIKVAMIIGIMGACRRNELYQLKYNEVKVVESTIFITIPNTKTKTKRTFTITGKYTEICKEYMMLRPKKCKSPYFFLNFIKDKCTLQRVGINKFGSLGKTIASYLKLPNPNFYTGHCFRRSSATILIDARGDIAPLKRHGRWESTSVAERISESIQNTIHISNTIKQSIENINCNEIDTSTNEASCPSTNSTLSLDVRSGTVVGEGAVIAQGAIIGPDVVIEAGASIGAAVIEERAYIGSGAVIGNGVRIGNGAIIGAEAVIGQGSFIRPGVVIKPREVIGGGELKLLQSTH